MYPQVLADLEAVLKRITDGIPVDSETSRRIEERADRITEEIRPRVPRAACLPVVGASHFTSGKPPVAPGVRRASRVQQLVCHLVPAPDGDSVLLID